MVSARRSWKRAPSAMELLCGGHLLLSGGRGGGEGAGEHALGGGMVDDGPRQGRDGHRDVLLQGAVAGRVIRHPVLPASPYDSAPGAPEGADRAGMVVPALAGAGVEVLGPGV